MKKIKLTPIDEEFDGFDEFEDLEEPDAGKSLNFEFDLTPYLTTCAIACGILFVVRFVEKHILHMR